MNMSKPSLTGNFINISNIIFPEGICTYVKSRKYTIQRLNLQVSEGIPYLDFCWSTWDNGKGRRKKIAEVSVLPSNCLLQNFKEEKQTMQANINLLFEPKFAISLLLEPAILISFDDKISPSPSHCWKFRKIGSKDAAKPK